MREGFEDAGETVLEGGGAGLHQMLGKTEQRELGTFKFDTIGSVYTIDGRM